MWFSSGPLGNPKVNFGYKRYQLGLDVEKAKCQKLSGYLNNLVMPSEVWKMSHIHNIHTYINIQTDTYKDLIAFILKFCVMHKHRNTKLPGLYNRVLALVFAPLYIINQDYSDWWNKLRLSVQYEGLEFPTIFFDLMCNPMEAVE